MKRTLGRKSHELIEAWICPVQRAAPSHTAKQHASALDAEPRCRFKTRNRKDCDDFCAQSSAAVGHSSEPRSLPGRADARPSNTCGAAVEACCAPQGQMVTPRAAVQDQKSSVCRAFRFQRRRFTSTFPAFLMWTVTPSRSCGRLRLGLHSRRRRLRMR
jgi:hypothetical protein